MSIVQSASQQFETVKADGIATYKSLDARLSKVELLKKIESQTKVKPIHVVSGVAVAFVLFLLFGFGANALTNLVGFLYPLYASFTALKSPSSEDDTFWLTYWVVYSFFGLVESFMDMTMGWIPLYHLCKLVFLVWSFLPQTKGAQLIFTMAIDPIMAQLPAFGGGVNLNVQRSAAPPKKVE